MTAPAHSSSPESPVESFLAKLSAGLYAYDEVACFCGATGGANLARVDRYCLPCEVILCGRCGLVRQERRMSREGAARFYAEDYFAIYGDSGDPAFRTSLLGRTSLAAFTEHYDIHPSRVLDYGSKHRSVAADLASDECEVVGYDIGDPWPEGRFDLVVMHHVLEHLGDLELELERIRELLNPGGFLIVSVPGNRSTKESVLYQNAHNWYFSAETLTYVMECMGFDEWYCDEVITSLWQVRPKRRARGAIASDQASNSAAIFFGDPNKLPLIQTHHKTPLADRRKNLRGALERALPDLGDLIDAHAGRSAVIIGAGPSVDEYAERIRELRSAGAIIVSVEKMLSWCEASGLGPDFCLIMDAGDDVAASLSDPPLRTTYVVASQCHPSTFDALFGLNARIMHQAQKGLDYEALWKEYGYDRAVLLNAGGSVTIGCMSLAHLAGCDTLHVFGFDCHFAEDRQYAAGARGVGSARGVMDVRIEDRVFHTTAGYFSFAQQFFIWLGLTRETARPADVRIYGDSLIKAMSGEDLNGDE